MLYGIFLSYVHGYTWHLASSSALQDLTSQRYLGKRYLGKQKDMNVISAPYISKFV